MRQILKYIVACLALLTAASCATDTTTIHGFEADTSNIDAKASGGKYNVTIRSEKEWTAVVDAPWVMVSPANGRGEVRCEVRIDSTLVNDARTTEIRFSSGGSLLQSVSVNQEGYARAINTYFSYRVTANQNGSIKGAGEKWKKSGSHKSE